MLVRDRSFCRHRQLIVGGLTVLLVLAGCADSEPESSSGVREITVEMESFAYEPASFSVEAGTTVRFVFRNPDNVVHKAIIRDAEFQEEHEKRAAGKRRPPRRRRSSRRRAGARGELTHTFDMPGTLLIGCHEAGHYRAV